MNKSNRFLLLKMFALSGLLVLLTSSAHAWRVQLPGGSRAESVVVDAAGDIIAAGRAYYGGELIKLSGTTGQLIWQFNASHNETEQGINAMALDSHGDVFLLIGTSRRITKISGATGQRIWSKPIGGSTSACQSFFSAIVVDYEDNVIAAGTAACMFNVAKLDGVTGDERWHYEREGYGKAVAVDPFGNVAAAGLINKNFGVVKLLGENGAELWEREINGPGNFTDVFEEANAVAMGVDGSVVGAGVSVNVTGEFNDCTKEFTVVKYSPDGTTEWTRIINGSLLGFDDHGHLHNGASDQANAVTIDSNNDVIAAGSLQVSPEVDVSAPEHFHVFKFSGTSGNTLWDSAAEDPALNGGYARGWCYTLAVNAAGNVVAGGLHNARFTLVKFWGRTGGRAWRRQLTSGSDPSGNGNQANRVLMDAASDVIAAGETIPLEGGLSQFTVVKLNRKDGLDYNAEGPPDNVPDIVVENAPYVYLYSDDQYRPGNPLTFITHSSLGWSHAGKCNEEPVVALGSVEPQLLGVNNGGNGGLPYSHSPNLATLESPDCTHDLSITFKSSDYTRPFDKERGEYRDNPGWVIWYSSFFEREGFYLDLDDRDPTQRNGIPDEPGNAIYPGAPVFYQYVERSYITYWFFYPYDSFEVLGVGAQAHEGDWERITVVLDDNEDPVLIFYYQHNGSSFEFWDPAKMHDGSHPIVFSARGSHASYPDTPLCSLGEPCGEQRDHGPAWSTWNDLSNVETQPWYGFGGAWGEVRNSFPVPDSDSTGPLGPSRYKR